MSATKTKTDSLSCRNCASENLSTVLSFENWLAHAKDIANDQRTKMAGIVSENENLNFGHIVKCKDCDFLSVENVPNDQALSDFYQAYYANADYKDKREKKIKRATRRIKRLSTLVNGSRFLDVGCNLGYAVEAAGKLGFDAHGIDVDEKAVEMAKQDFPNWFFELTNVKEFAQTEMQFDLVYCSEVIEHVPDFRDFAKDIAKLVSPGGVLFLTTPDAGHFKTPGNLLDWYEIKPPEHLQWFRKKHLKALFKEFGMDAKFRFNWKPGIQMIARKKA